MAAGDGTDSGGAPLSAGGTAEQPVGLIYIALSDGKDTWVTKRSPIGRTKSRDWHRYCAASQALDMVRRYLFGMPVVADYTYQKPKNG